MVGRRGEILGDLINASTRELEYLSAALGQIRAARELARARAVLEGRTKEAQAAQELSSELYREVTK